MSQTCFEPGQRTDGNAGLRSEIGAGDIAAHAQLLEPRPDGIERTVLVVNLTRIVTEVCDFEDSPIRTITS